MIEEYKKSDHFKKKMENYKINKIMGRVKKKAKGPNPLSCKKRKSYYENREKIKLNTENNEVNNIDTNFEKPEKCGDGEIQDFLKKKRKRKRKNKKE